MSGAGDVVCEGWLRKSPPEKKIRRYAWKRRWFVLRSGRLTGESDILQYYKNPQSRRPIRIIDLNLCEQVDAGLSFPKKELESSFVFDLKTLERTWYLVADSEEDMNRWVTSICLLCGFSPTDDVPERPTLSGSSSIAAISSASSTAAINAASGSAPPPHNQANVRPMEAQGSTDEDYMWLSHCESHIRRPSLGSPIAHETDYNDNLCPPPSATSSSSSSSSSPSPLPNSLPPTSSSSTSSSRMAPWTVAAVKGSLSRSMDAGMICDLQKRAGRPRCHPSPHPRKHSLDFLLRPVSILLSDDKHSVHQSMPSHSPSGYQIPRQATTPLSRAPRRPSSTPSVDSLTQAELHASTASPPPRPPKPPSAVPQGAGTEPAMPPRSTSESERRDAYVGGGTRGPLRSNTFSIPGRTHSVSGGESLSVPRILSEQSGIFEFSESFNSYFLNKGMVPLGSIGSEDDDVETNYVPMSAATTERPVAPRVPPPRPSDPTACPQDGNYVPMTPVTSSLPTCPTTATNDLASLGRQVPPPAHMGFRNPASPAAPLTPPLHRNAVSNVGGVDADTIPPPIHRNLKPKHRGIVKPAPLDLTSLQQDWQEVPPPVRSPVTRSFTRDPSWRLTARPTSSHSSSPSSDSDDQDENYVAMTTSGLSASAGEQSLRLLLHRASEGGVSSPMLRRTRGDKQVEYLDLDLHTWRSTPPRQKRCTVEGERGGAEQARPVEEPARGEHTRVDYVVVDPKRTKALRNTREAWHDGRMSTEKEKC